MTIAEAEERCMELNKQIFAIRKEYDFDGWAKYSGRTLAKPLRDELNELLLAITKAKETTEIEI